MKKLILKIFGLFKPLNNKKQEKAIVVPIFNKNTEYIDLNKKHKRFFENSPELSPTMQLQPKFGRDQQVEILSHISDVTPSRSQRFFQEAPNIDKNTEYPELTEDFDSLEKYMGINLNNDEYKN